MKKVKISKNFEEAQKSLQNDYKETKKLDEKIISDMLSKGGVKYDNEKERYDLFPPYSLNELAKVYTYGTKKYDDRNWEKGMKWGKIFAALMRHAWAFWRGEEIDSESGLPHMAHAAWNCIALLEYSKTRREFDDRVKYADDKN